jgi:hypothetical protein
VSISLPKGLLGPLKLAGFDPSPSRRGEVTVKISGEGPEKVLVRLKALANVVKNDERPSKDLSERNQGRKQLE